MQTNKITPHYATSYEVGAILYDSWGYEQTNIDFYCIIERKGEWLTLLPMKKSTSKEASFQSMTNHVKPVEINYTAKPIRKKLKVFNGKESGFSFRNYTGGGWCSLWNGKEVTESHYA